MQKQETKVFRNLQLNIKKRMFSMMERVDNHKEDGDQLWDLDAENGFLSYSKMCYVRN